MMYIMKEKLNNNIKTNIYKAQCFGNVEPIEYMVPYPNMYSLIEGQNIKFSEQIIYEKNKITNYKFYELVHQTAYWLDSLKIKPKERVIIQDIGFPQTGILLFGIWSLGASAVILESSEIENAKRSCKTNHLIKNNVDLFEIINNLPFNYNPKYKALLSDEALVFWSPEKGIRLSHYNLLSNTNSIQKITGIKSRTRIFCDLESNSTSWAVLKVILPIYCGCIFTNSKPDITISEKDQNSTFFIRKDLKHLEEFKSNQLSICPENSAVLSLGKQPIHLTNFSKRKNVLLIKGHSVMMGYLDDEKNRLSFRDGTLYIYL